VLPAVVLLAAAGVCVWVVVRRHCKVAEG
jgi:hypothetical protein